MSERSPVEEFKKGIERSLGIQSDPVIFTIYSSHGDSGGETGIGRLLAYHREESQAKEYCKKKGWYGGDGGVVKHACMEINGKYYLLKQPDPIKLDLNVQQVEAELRQRALAKLTDEEKKILGVS